MLRPLCFRCKIHRKSLNMRLVVSQSLCERCGERKVLLKLLGNDLIFLKRPVPSLDTVLTEMPSFRFRRIKL